MFQANCTVARNVREPFSFRLSDAERAELRTLDDGGRFCTAPWSTFDDKSASEQVVARWLTLVAKALFSVAGVDVTNTGLGR